MMFSLVAELHRTGDNSCLCVTEDGLPSTQLTVLRAFIRLMRWQHKTRWLLHCKGAEQQLLPDVSMNLHCR